MSDRVERLLDLLAEDRRAEAEGALEAVLAERGSAEPAEREALISLRFALRGDGSLPPAEEPARTTLARTLVEMTRAAVALREGRVGDLVDRSLALQRGLPDPGRPHPWLLLRVASLLQAAFRFTGDGEVHTQAIEACTRAGNATEAPRMAVYGRALLGSIHMMSGSLHAAQDRIDAALELADQAGIADEAPAALATQFRAYLLWEQNLIAPAETALVRAWRITTDEDRGIRSGVARVLSTLTAVQGRVEESDRWLAELEAIVREPMTLRNREWLAAVRLTQAVLVSRVPARSTARRRAGLREIERWRRSWAYQPAEVEGWTDAHLRTRLHELDHVLTLLELTGQWTDAEALARRVASAAGPLRRGYRIRAWTVLAVALEHRSETEAADEAWAHALRDGAENGFVRSFLEGAPARARIHGRALVGPDTGALARRVSAAADGWPEGSDPELTPRQLDVLRAVAEGRSNREIADRLGISESTVRTHLRTILPRLGATSRTHAVAVARGRGLLP